MMAYDFSTKTMESSSTDAHSHPHVQEEAEAEVQSQVQAPASEGVDFAHNHNQTQDNRNHLLQQYHVNYANYISNNHSTSTTPSPNDLRNALAENISNMNAQPNRRYSANNLDFDYKLASPALHHHHHHYHQQQQQQQQLRVPNSSSLQQNSQLWNVNTAAISPNR
ncbi:hypothetical protein PP707_05155, partial [Acetobacter pasteurianus]|nr:hypothetical protein [Acetobacter pasteurianus]